MFSQVNGAVCQCQSRPYGNESPRPNWNKPVQLPAEPLCTHTLPVQCYTKHSHCVVQKENWRHRFWWFWYAMETLLWGHRPLLISGVWSVNHHLDKLSSDVHVPLRMTWKNSGLMFLILWFRNKHLQKIHHMLKHLVLKTNPWFHTGSKWCVKVTPFIRTTEKSPEQQESCWLSIFIFSFLVKTLLLFLLRVCFFPLTPQTDLLCKWMHKSAYHLALRERKWLHTSFSSWYSEDTTVREAQQWTHAAVTVCAASHRTKDYQRY